MMRAIIFGASLVAANLIVPAMAQGPRTAPAPAPRVSSPMPTVNLPFDPLNLNNKAATVPTCDMNIFADMRHENLKQFLDACAVKLASDSKAALDDATAKSDQTAIACLKPGAEILAAAVPAKDANGNDVEPGILLMFQKWRDFVLAGGPSACRAWVTTTVTGAIAP